MTEDTPGIATSKYEWIKYPLPAGLSPIGRVFEAGEVNNSLGTERRMRPRSYPGYALVYLTGLRGTGYYEDFSGHRCVLTQGDCILVHPERTHSYGPDPGALWSEIYVSFDGPVFDELARRGLLAKDRVPVFRPGEGDRTLRLRRCVFDEIDVPLPMTVAAGRIVALIAELAVIRDAEKPAGNDSWIARAAIDLEREGASVAAVCAAYGKETGLSADAVRKRFRRATGDSMENRRLNARLAAAVALIEQSDSPLKTIAHKLGFANEQHFSRTIARATGFTPGALRARSGFSRGEL